MKKSRKTAESSVRNRARNDSRATGGSAFQVDLARLALDQTKEFIWWLDAEARIVYANPAFRQALDYPPVELYLLHIWDFSPLTAASWPARYAELRTMPSQLLLFEMRTRSGGVVPVQIETRYVTSKGKGFLLCVGHHLQTSGAPETAAEIVETAQTEPGVDAIFLLHDGNIVGDARPSGGLRHQLGQDLKSMLATSVTIGARMARALRGEQVIFDWYVQRSPTVSVNIECTLHRIELEGHVRLLALVVDATSRHRSARMLSQLTGRLLELQDEERRRIARELHDSTGQHIGAIGMNLSLLLSSEKHLSAQSRKSLRDSIALADSSVRDIRTLSYLLHPPLLDEFGLAAALRSYSEGYAERTGVKMELDLPARTPRLPQAIEIALFRIVQEGISNIHRHSGSKEALVRLMCFRDSVELEIVDRGRGLPPGTIESDATLPSRLGVGIAGMRERARQLGGRLTIASHDRGTRLHVVLPLLHSQQLDAAVGRS